MINFKIIRKQLLLPKSKVNLVNPQDYMKHFQLAVINLEQNLIEERMPELRKSA